MLTKKFKARALLRSSRLELLMYSEPPYSKSGMWNLNFWQKIVPVILKCAM